LKRILFVEDDPIVVTIHRQRLELQVSVEPSGSGPGALIAQLVLTTDSEAMEGREHLAGITAAAGTLPTASLAGAESSFAVCGQLAQAMAGLARFEPAADRQIRLLVMLPIAIVPRLELAPASPTSLIRMNETLEQREPVEVLAASTVEDG
jgi:hypothetical protein